MKKGSSGSKRCGSSLASRISWGAAWRSSHSPGASPIPDVSTVITGASKPEQVEQNMRAMEVVPLLTPEVLDRIERDPRQRA